METQGQAVTMHTGATVNGIQTEAEVLMKRHTPTDWPDAGQALSTWASLCASLKAQDHEVPIQALSMNTLTGGLFNANKLDPKKGVPVGVIPTHTALSHLMAFVDDAPASSVANLEYYPPHVRAQMLAVAVAKTKQRTVVMRTAIEPQNSRMVVRAVTSDKHSQSDGDDLAIIEQIRRLDLSNAKMRVVKQWDRTHVELYFPNKVREVKPGVVIGTRINLENSETKGGSYVASVGNLNLVCLNGMVGGGDRSTVTVKHMGNIKSRIRAGIVTVIDLAEVYLDEYIEAYRTPLPMTRADAIAATVKRFKLPENTGHALAALWDVDGERGGGETVAGMANAMTRHAQALNVADALRMEGYAGELVSEGREAFL